MSRPSAPAPAVLSSPQGLSQARFALAWVLPLGVALGALHALWTAYAVMLVYQVTMALAERVPAWRHSPPAVAQTAWHRACLRLRLHLPLQLGLLGWGLYLVAGLAAEGVAEGLPGAGWSWADAAAVAALGLAVGGVTGSQGITFAHELGHSRNRFDRACAWLLMASVNYAHFMVEHYRGHHVRAATLADPATAREGESLWRFLPRTLAGSWASAWQLEAQRLHQLRRPWWRSTLAWVTAGQLLWLALLGALLGPLALLFWLLHSVHAVFLLESINYIEHYGLLRRPLGSLQRKQQSGQQGGHQTSQSEPFGLQHAWNADHWLTNSMVANLQRHSDHHLHAWKPYAELQPLPGPQLPTGYAGCLFMAWVPRWWFAVMHPRLRALQAAATS